MAGSTTPLLWTLHALCIFQRVNFSFSEKEKATIQSSNVQEHVSSFTIQTNNIVFTKNFNNRKYTDKSNRYYLRNPVLQKTKK